MSSGKAAVVAAVAGKVAEWLTLALLLTLVPRLLGPADYGTFGLALALVTLGSASLALGGPATMARFVAAVPAPDRAGLARALAMRALRWRAAGLAIAWVVAVPLAVAFPHRLPPADTAIVLTALTLDSAATLAFQVALGLGRPLLWSFRYPVQNLLLVAAVVPLYAVGGMAGALAAIACASAGALLLGSVASGRQLLGAPSGQPVPREASRFALLQAVSGLLVLLQYRGGVVAVALLARSRLQTGYAALTFGIAVALTYAIWQVYTVALPRFASLAAADVEAAAAALARFARIAVLAFVPAAILAALVAEPMLTLLAGSRFSAAKDALGPALATAPLAPLTGAVGVAAAVRLRPGARVWTAAAGAAVFVATALVLVPAFGAAGATGALLAATAATALVGAALFPELVDRRLIALSFAASALVLAVGLAWK
jgi:O-antigen/teichoic acid export membrane protein